MLGPGAGLVSEEHTVLTMKLDFRPSQRAIADQARVGHSGGRSFKGF